LLVIPSNVLLVMLINVFLVIPSNVLLVMLINVFVPLIQTDSSKQPSENRHFLVPLPIYMYT
jgi:hypothetical protein